MNVVRPQTVLPPVAHLDQLKMEVYTLGTTMRQVSSESGMSVDTVKALLLGSHVEQSTAARLEAYLKALARNEFSAVRSLKKYEKGALSGQGKKLERKYYALHAELWREYKFSKGPHPDNFTKLDRRHKFIAINIEERDCKLHLMARHKGFIDRFRVWFADGWTYWRWKSYLKKKIADKSAITG